LSRRPLWRKKWAEEKNELEKSRGQTKKWAGEKNRLKEIIGWRK